MTTRKLLEARLGECVANLESIQISVFNKIFVIVLP